MLFLLFAWLTALSVTSALRWDAEHVGYNLNENQTATHPRDYWGEWDNHTHHASPKNWRFPFYMLTLDRYLDGDPSNNEANGTVFEHHWMTNQFRFGGDTVGLQGDLDYIQGMGIKALYIVGSPFLNRPWSGDGFGPLDMTLLDRHHGSIDDWRSLITEIHRRDMYVIFDNTMATLGDLIAFDGFVNKSTPFNWHEYDYLWKTETRYHDFHPGNARNDSCQYPRIWGQDGFPLTQDILDLMNGCKDSEFDQHGAYPSYINSLSKFASVQDRLREWRPDVLEKINRMSCMVISMLDIDGFRMDKALQTTVDAMAEFSSYQRACARRHGKDNFLVVGEVVGDPNLASVYVGRGRQPDQALERGDVAVTVSNKTDPNSFIRPFGMSALDSQAFNYDIYGAMTRFLGLDGPWGARGVDWVEQWNFILKHNDMVNANTGEFDVRHIYGMSNHDVFRWPSLANGTQRQLLGFFVTMLELPGIPMVLWGEEQEFYVLENLSNDYLFGRTPIGSSSAWQLHGCYHLGQDVYTDMPFNSSGQGCYDDSVSLDHRDPAKPMRNVLKRMFELRQQYPVLNDGFNLTTLSNRTYEIFLRGSNGIPSPHGIWSVYRGRSPNVQDFTGTGQGNQPIWLLYSNENQSTTYDFDCSSPNISSALISAFPANTVVKNLFYPYEEHKLEPSVLKLGLEGSKEFNGCLSQLQMSAWGYKAFVPKAKWVTPRPTITKTMPSHDERLFSAVGSDQAEVVDIEIRFSSIMDCASVTGSIELYSSTDDQQQPRLARDSVICGRLEADPPRSDGEIPTAWTFRAKLENVFHGVHTVTVRNATSATGNLTTGSADRFMFRIGRPDNPMVFTKLANYSRTLLHRHEDTGKLYIAPRAAGADKFRYSRNWGTSFSPWIEYTGANLTLQSQPWSGTKQQKWTGEHVVVHYWSRLTGSSDHVQHADLDRGPLPPRRFPHVFVQGDFNQFGYDGGLPSDMHLDSTGVWRYDLIADFPSSILFNVWGMNPDGFPDKSQALGDVDGDFVLDWVPPESLARNLVNITKPPPDGYLGYRLFVNDGTYRYHFAPIGSAWIQLVVGVLLGVVPILTALFGIRMFMRLFYRVKFNHSGVREKVGRSRVFRFLRPESENLQSAVSNIFQQTPNASTGVHGSQPRRKILIASLEYEIEDWNIKIKIGGLGAMASLMGKHLTEHELIWVVPCVGDIQYPQGIAANQMEATVMGKKQDILVQYHMLGRITFVILDSPVFRKQTKLDPYPKRMDDLESATFYSIWNQCISQAIARFEPSIYHINDYHGAAAPLYLLPHVVPCCLSLHNAEFQGLWSLGTASDMQQVCSVFNLDKDIVEKYVQFGGVFNLLHAGASYLRIHQRGYGAAGVSEKYSARSKQRYPILWGLPKVTALPNPDPDDLENMSETPREVTVDEAMEASRAMLRTRAQEWAGLNIDPQADLFVFVGRWSMQKGIDIVADVFFSVLRDHPSTQLICIGPVIDLYGRFAALKLEKLAQLFPGRVYSKPEFVVLPPFIFSGAEFALIPSRDEPFGLVAVEFGRKGALGVGSMVGGLGQMPGWWFTIESLTSKHLMYQLKHAIRNALASDQALRSRMRARALVQRFPVRQWVDDVDKLQAACIRIHRKQQEQSSLGQVFRKSLTPSASGKTTPRERSNFQTPVMGRSGSPVLGPIPSLPMPPMPPPLVLDGFTLERSSLDRGSLDPSSRPTTSLRESVGNESSDPPAAEAAPNDTENPGQGATPRQGPTSFNPRWTLQLLGRMSHSSFSSLFRSQPGSTSDRHDPEASSLESDRKKPDVYRTEVIFTDSQDEFSQTFRRKLEKLNAKSSEGKLCIQEFLVQSEKTWFSRFHRASLGLTQDRMPRSLQEAGKWLRGVMRKGPDEETPVHGLTGGDQFQLGEDYEPPSGMRKLLQKKIGDWQLYCFFLAFGQIIAANSYQLTILTGEYGQAALKLYIIASVYMGATLVWWYLYRRCQALYVLSLPFLVYGMAFFTLGMGLYAPNVAARNWIFNVATGLYAAASASGSLFFALNFGTEAGTPAQTWAFRACVIQGTQQIYVAFLWYWGAMIDRTGRGNGPPFSSKVVTCVTVPLAVLMWAVGIIVYLGLPSYYRRRPGDVPSFYRSLIRRKSVLWFFIMVVLQNYFLSTTYNRNWKFLWSSQHTPPYTIILLLLFFFLIIWTLLLLFLSHLSATHAWLLPIFGISLGCPRWSQTLWATSGIALSTPSPLSPLLGALLSRSLWLWLGVLDALQGIGFGMILLQTLTRVHVAATLVGSQVLGSAVTVLARATAPHRVGPGEVFPNFGLVGAEGLGKVWFWVGLLAQGVICAGFAWVFREEQLFKP